MSIFDASGRDISTREEVAAGFTLKTDWNQTTGLGIVTIWLPGLERPIEMLPAEAQKLGMMLIKEGEAAVYVAAYLQTLIGGYGISPTEAMTMLVNISKACHVQHARAYAESMRKQEQAKKMEATSDDLGTPQ